MNLRYNRTNKSLNDAKNSLNKETITSQGISL